MVVVRGWLLGGVLGGWVFVVLGGGCFGGVDFLLFGCFRFVVDGSCVLTDVCLDCSFGF